MKYFRIFAILLFVSVFSFYSCNDKTNTPKEETLNPSEVIDSSTPTTAATPDPATPEAAQNAEGIWHYTCSKGCYGGAGSASNCVTCGGLLAHNSAYHADANSTPTSTPTDTPPAAAEPSQNTAGVWHYTCSNGCAGGSGAAGPCSTCAGTLAHNSAYHQ